jgi:hypothetical protein
LEIILRAKTNRGFFLILPFCKVLLTAEALLYEGLRIPSTYGRKGGKQKKIIFGALSETFLVTYCIPNFDGI